MDEVICSFCGKVMTLDKRMQYAFGAVDWYYCPEKHGKGFDVKPLTPAPVSTTMKL